MKTKLILLEDDLDLGTVLKQYLEFSDFDVLWFDHPKKLVNNIDELKNAQLLILDVMMPEMDGFTLIKNYKNQFEIPFLFLTAKAQIFDRILGLKLGGEDYITKPCDPEELVLRIQNILRRFNATKNDLVKIGLYEFNSGQLTLKTEKNVYQLTEKESELLTFFIQHNQQLLTRKEILENIWGENDYFMGRSLDVFMSRLRKYFQEDDKIKFDSVRGVGFKIDLPLK